MEPVYIKLDTVKSTSSYLAEHIDGKAHGTVVTTREQTAGRGQRGNSWEAEPGKNLTFSILLKPKYIKAQQQFYVSEIVSIAIVDVLKKLITNKNVLIKWPNDIYVDNDKICGILIENALMGNSIDRSIAGIGININQRKFLSDAPNPISLFNIIGKETDLDLILGNVCNQILSYFDLYDSDITFAKLHERYCSLLWRCNGDYLYRDNSTGETFIAAIASIATNGMLTLKLSDNSLRTYAFKEVSPII